MWSSVRHHPCLTKLTILRQQCRGAIHSWMPCSSRLSPFQLGFLRVQTQDSGIQPPDFILHFTHHLCKYTNVFFHTSSKYFSVWANLTWAHVQSWSNLYDCMRVCQHCNFSTSESDFLAQYWRQTAFCQPLSLLKPSYECSFLRIQTGAPWFLSATKYSNLDPVVWNLTIWPIYAFAPSSAVYSIPRLLHFPSWPQALLDDPSILNVNFTNPYWDIKFHSCCSIVSL